jgi:hypothetical protein
MMGHEALSPGYDPAGGVTHGASPWDGGSSDHGLSQDAGVGDIGGQRAAAYDDDGGNNNNNNDGGFLGGSVDDLAGNQPDSDYDGDDFDDGDGGDFDTA